MPTSADRSKTDQRPGSPWWGTYSPEIDETIRIAFGPSHAQICRREREWQVFSNTTTPEPKKAVKASFANTKSMPENVQLKRFFFSLTESKLSVSPALADRPVVARPAHVLAIPPGVSVCLYVSSPLWIIAEVHDHPLEILDVPIFRPSDLWFGPSTWEGKLCYSSLTDARIDKANLLHRSYRAITPVVVKNDDLDVFNLDRISLPVPYLTIFSNERGEIWTDVFTLVCGKGGATASMDISGKMPKEAGKGKILRKPREIMPESSMLNTIHEWLG